ncbi:MAG: DUF2723 domain-containing protein [Phycisphaerae bacterium]|nr:DUF2723 domain-containing protein [Phycisphaerae bacterium]
MSRTENVPERPAAHTALALRAALGIALLSLVLFVVTQAPEVQPGDSAELALVAHELGITHPPGYPLHTFTGKGFAWMFGDPARGTRMLSAVSTAGAVALLCLIAIRLTGSVSAGARAAGVLAVVPAIWSSAVITEIYSVNLFFVALSLLLFLRWAERPVLSRGLAAGAVLGLSLGSGLANLLMLPGFLVLFFGVRPIRWRQGLLTAAMFVASGALIESWNYFRAASYLPLGTQYVPNTLGGLLRYLSGAQFGTTMVQPPGFYLGRLIEHGLHVLASLSWIGIIPAAIGVAVLWGRSRGLVISLGLMFAGNFLYFTGHPWVDYQEMINPSYFLICLFLACGLAWMQQRKRRFWEAAGTAIPIIVTAWLLVVGLFDHPPQSTARPVTSFVTASLERFPPDAVAVCDWYKFAPMVYFQRVHGMRPDVTLVEAIRQPRRYAWGMVDDAWTFAEESAATRPVFVDSIPPVTTPGDAANVSAPAGWFALPMSTP